MREKDNDLKKLLSFLQICAAQVKIEEVMYTLCDRMTTKISKIIIIEEDIVIAITEYNLLPQFRLASFTSRQLYFKVLTCNLLQKFLGIYNT